MQFLILGYDGADKEALNRRMENRQQHLSYCEGAVKRGEQLVGAAMLNEEGNMCGSVMIVDFPSREELEEWLQNEVYITEGVWQKVEVIPCRVAPTFTHLYSGKEEPLKRAESK